MHEVNITALNISERKRRRELEEEKENISIMEDENYDDDEYCFYRLMARNNRWTQGKRQRRVKIHW